MRKLPVRMHEKHGAFYYVHRNKWTRLGSDYAEAIKKYSLLIIDKKSGDLPEFISRLLKRLQRLDFTKFYGAL